MLSCDGLVERLVELFREHYAAETEFGADSNLYDLDWDFFCEDSQTIQDWFYDFAQSLGFDLTLDDIASFLPRETSYEDWETVVKPRLTCRHIGEWLWQRLPRATFEPVNIAGRVCGPAGVFFGIEALIAHVCPQTNRFAPSSRILDHLQGRLLRRFWAQVRLQTGAPLAEPFDWWLAIATCAAWGCVLLGIAAIVGMLVSERLLFMIFVWLGSIPVTLIVMLAWWMASPYYIRLPHRIRTFRDLATYVSDQVSIAARTESNACPR